MSNTKATGKAKGTARKDVRTKTRDGRAAGRRAVRGTRQEVRESALMPWQRTALAASMREYHNLFSRGTLNRDECKARCAELRKDGIKYGMVDADNGILVRIPTEKYIKISAGSRLVRDSVEEYFDELWRSEIDSLLDVAEAETGKREIPLNRHERAALARFYAEREKNGEAARAAK